MSSNSKDSLIHALSLIVDRHERALRILAGEYVPTSEELSAIAESVKTKPAESIRRGKNRKANISAESPQLSKLLRAEELEQAITAAGGWSHIAAAAAYVKERYPDSWAIFEEYVTFAEPGGVSRLPGEGVIGRLCDLHGLDKDTVIRLRQTVLYLIAKCALLCPDSQLELSGAAGK